MHFLAEGKRGKAFGEKLAESQCIHHSDTGERTMYLGNKYPPMGLHVPLARRFY